MPNPTLLYRCVVEDCNEMLLHTGFTAHFPCDTFCSKTIEVTHNVDLTLVEKVIRYLLVDTYPDIHNSLITDLGGPPAQFSSYMPREEVLKTAHNVAMVIGCVDVDGFPGLERVLELRENALAVLRLLICLGNCCFNLDRALQGGYVPTDAETGSLQLHQSPLFNPFDPAAMRMMWKYAPELLKNEQCMYPTFTPPVAPEMKPALVRSRPMVAAEELTATSFCYNTAPRSTTGRTENSLRKHVLDDIKRNPITGDEFIIAAEEVGNATRDDPLYKKYLKYVGNA